MFMLTCVVMATTGGVFLLVQSKSFPDVRTGRECSRVRFDDDANIKVDFPTHFNDFAITRANSTLYIVERE